MASSMRRVGVIDVGTNGVKILIADVTPLEVLPVYESSTQTRLGAGLYEKNTLRDDSILATSMAVADHHQRAIAHEASRVICVATSAMRDASNGYSLVQSIRGSCGLELVVLSGNREAELAFKGVQTDARLRDRDLLVVDVGGGSTELIFGSSSGIRLQRSFQLGAVRLAEDFKLSDPPSRHEFKSCTARIDGFLNEHVAPVFSPVIRERARFGPSPMIVGASGTSTVIARMHLQTQSFDRTLIERVTLSSGEVSDLCHLIWDCSLTDRKNLPGLPHNRADIIPFGVLIFSRLMALFESNQLCVSMRGLRFALAAELGSCNPPEDPLVSETRAPC